MGLLYNLLDNAMEANRRVRESCGLKDVIIRVMCHNIFYSAIQDITELVYCIHFYVAVMSQPVQLRAVHTVSGI